MGHPNVPCRGRAPARGLGSRPSCGSEGLTLTPVVVAAWGGSAGMGVVSRVSRVVSFGGSP